MRVFQMTANVTFEAEDIDDALRRLAVHFTDVALGDEYVDKPVGPDHFFRTGEITAEPLVK